MTRLGLRSLVVLVPILVACGSGGTAGPGSGGAGGSAHGGSGGGAGTSGAAGTGGGAGTAGSGGGGASGAAGSSGSGGAAGSGGATAGGGGSAGVGGSAGTSAGGGGSSGAGGTVGGRGGSSGSGGAAGNGGGTGGGTAGSAGARGGSGGSGGATGAGGTGGAPSGLRLEYQNSSATNTTFSVRLTNPGPATPLISTIKVRYYFLDDTSPNHDATPLVAIAQWKLAGTTTTIDLRMSPGCTTSTSFATPPLSSYVDFGCAWPSPMSAQDVITFTLTLNPPTQLASNDYSFADTAGAFAPNDHLLVLVNGTVQSGTPP